MAVNGTRFILAEFAIGILLLLVLGLYSLRGVLFGGFQAGWEKILGLWLVGMAANYIPLFIYAVLIARGGTVNEEGQAEIALIKRFTAQQFIIFVPLLVVFLTILQEVRRR